MMVASFICGLGYGYMVVHHVHLEPSMHPEIAVFIYFVFSFAVFVLFKFVMALGRAASLEVDLDDVQRYMHLAELCKPPK
jgi:hypothetical protein